MKISRIILLFVFALVLVSAGGIYYTYSKLNSKIDISEDIIISIPKNATLDQIVRILNARGLCEPTWFFEFALRVYAKYDNGKFYAGSYKFSPKNTNKHIIESIFTGNNLHILTVTYPEGITLKRFAEISHSKLGVDPRLFMRLITMDSLLSKYNITGRNAEGYLMPDTYAFFYDPDAEEVVNRLIGHNTKIWNDNFIDRAKKIGMSKHEVLTMASIIESETQIPEERSIVSGVYHNRLKKGWLLEADPTVQYALGSKKRLLYKDLEINNPYNTYKFPGLPPGPINNPGKASIEAALYPAIHNYMFFVALGDGSGKHNFAKSYSEHLSYVRIFRRNVRANN